MWHQSYLSPKSKTATQVYEDCLNFKKKWSDRDARLEFHEQKEKRQFMNMIDQIDNEIEAAKEQGLFHVLIRAGKFDDAKEMLGILDYYKKLGYSIDYDRQSPDYPSCYCVSWNKLDKADMETSDDED